jgi:hypothetical protein
MNEANQTLPNKTKHTLNDTNMNENTEVDSEGIVGGPYQPNSTTK